MRMSCQTIKSFRLLAGLGFFLLVLPAFGQVTVFQSDFQDSVVQANTAVTNLNAGTPIGTWSYVLATNVNIYGVAEGAQKALCPDSDGSIGYGLTANFTNAVLLNSNVTVSLLLARGRIGSPGTGKYFDLTGYDEYGNASFDLQVFANENQVAGTNGALYWNDGGVYTNWFGTNYSNAGDIRNLPVSATGYNPASMTALKIQLEANGYVVSVDTSNSGTFNWVSSLLPYNGSPTVISSISLSGGPGSGDWFDNFLVTGVPGSNTIPKGFVAVQPEQQAQLINGWGFDIKGVSGYVVTPAYAQTLFATNQMNILRLPIYGDAADPAHPTAGVVIGSYYANTLYAMTNTLAANSNVVLFASKKLDSTNTFPPWVKNSNGVIASQYALMLADYLEFMWTNGFAINVLGIDDESTYNEGNISASVYNDVINSLRQLAVSRGFPLPACFIAPENYSPDTNWLSELLDNGWGTNLDIVGTHYYPTSRPLASLQTLVALGGLRPDWQSEVHWDNTFGDVIDNAEAALATIFDCTDSGLSSFVWWEYTQSGIQGGIEQNFSLSTTQARPVSTTDSDGSGAVLGQLIARAFRNNTNLVIWVLNNTTNLYNPCNINFNAGSLSGPANYTQWNVSKSITGSSSLSSATNFLLTIGVRTVTEITVGYVPPATNTPLLLAPVTNQRLMAGQVLVVTNSAMDATMPAPVLTWSVQPAISGLTINPETGVLNWRPTVAQSPVTNVVSVIVTDSGTPSLSATQQFTVTVSRPVAPHLSVSPALAGTFNLAVAGDAGPDYTLLSSSNLTAWTAILTTNPAVLPFTWQLPGVTNASWQFYRIQLGP